MAEEQHACEQQKGQHHRTDDVEPVLLPDTKILVAADRVIDFAQQRFVLRGLRLGLAVRC